MEDEHKDFIDEMFNNLIDQSQGLLPYFRGNLTVAGKAIESFVNAHKYGVISPYEIADYTL